MEGVRTFLESSTIHGLTYISSTRKYARLLWILIVFAGFIGASLLIKESFASWSESPVKTTVETLPISQIRFPKVTVCPPKNTFTDLNYDLMLAENLTLTQEIRDEMFEYLVELIDKDRFSLSNWIKLNEKDRFYNWYHGYTQIYEPFYKDYGDSGLNYNLHTSATSGVVTTQHFGGKFYPDLVEKKTMYRIKVYAPQSVDSKKMLHFKMEKVSVTGLASNSKDRVFITGLGYLDSEQTSAYTNFTLTKDYRYIKLERYVTSDDLNTTELDMMPGFRFSWWYTSSDGVEVTPEPQHKYADNEITKHLAR